MLEINFLLIFFCHGCCPEISSRVKQAARATEMGSAPQHFFFSKIAQAGTHPTDEKDQIVATTVAVIAARHFENNRCR